MASANDRQEDGDHYKRHRGVEPWDIIAAWGLGFLDGNVVKYMSRWRNKNGLQDLKKARHYLDKLIEVEEGKKYYELIPSSYTSGEGNTWRDWTFGRILTDDLDKRSPTHVSIASVSVHALQFENMRVWDCVNGWRVK